MRYWESPEWQAIRTFLPRPGGTALDIGAGNGISSYALAKDGWHVTALEPDPSKIVGAGAIRCLALTQNLAIEVLQDLGERIPSADETFDVVFARQVLHHARNLPQLCQEIFRVLKPGGTLVAVRDHVISSPNDLPRFFAAHPLHHLYGGENAHRLRDYLSALKSGGLIVRIVIRPFDSVINYAPHTRDSLREELKRRLRRLPLTSVATRILNVELIMNISLALLSRIDRSPGRLYSFICSKPERYS